ncbi:hypothetical protein LCGC14_0355730 [marine sediment metagenome]|uniref:Uncharacterized protein n=1 Tax=marine sediment metagenome TaxID=412755 RepID=A0A0F9VWL1_9ZZZZ
MNNDIITIEIDKRHTTADFVWAITKGGIDVDKPFDIIESMGKSFVGYPLLVKFKPTIQVVWPTNCVVGVA